MADLAEHHKVDQLPKCEKLIPQSYGQHILGNSLSLLTNLMVSINRCEHTGKMHMRWTKYAHLLHRRNVPNTNQLNRRCNVLGDVLLLAVSALSYNTAHPN